VRQGERFEPLVSMDFGGAQKTNAPGFGGVRAHGMHADRYRRKEYELKVSRVKRILRVVPNNRYGKKGGVEGGSGHLLRSRTLDERNAIGTLS